MTNQNGWLCLLLYSGKIQAFIHQNYNDEMNK